MRWGRIVSSSGAWRSSSGVSTSSAHAEPFYYRSPLGRGAPVRWWWLGRAWPNQTTPSLFLNKYYIRFKRGRFHQCAHRARRAMQDWLLGELMELPLPTDGMVVIEDVFRHCMHAAMQDWLLSELMEWSWFTDGITPFDDGESHCNHTAMHD